MSRAAAVPGSRWYRPQNQGRRVMQVAIERYADELARKRLLGRGEKQLVDLMARFVDARGITQKSIAFLAEGIRTTERTVQRYLRRLCPNKETNPAGWEKRILPRQYIHAVPEPGKKRDNLPSWFRFDTMDPKFLQPLPSASAAKRRGGLRLIQESSERIARLGEAPAPRAQVSAGNDQKATSAQANSPRNFRGISKEVPARRPGAGEKKLSPGGGEKITQAGIIGSETKEISETLPSLLPPGPATRAGEAPTTADPPAEQVENARGETPRTPSAPPKWQPKHVELVVLAARLFPSHVAKAPEAIARLEALGLTADQIAAKLRRDSKDRSLELANHPLLAAVSRAEKAFLLARSPPPSNDRQRPASAEQTPILRGTAVRTVDLAERARFAEMSARVARAGLPEQPRDPGDGDGGRGGPGDVDEPGGGEDVGGEEGNPHG